MRLNGVWPEPWPIWSEFRMIVLAISSAGHAADPKTFFPDVDPGCLDCFAFSKHGYCRRPTCLITEKLQYGRDVICPGTVV